MQFDVMPSTPLSRTDLLSALQDLPERTPLSTRFPDSQKRMWIDWLSNYTDRQRDARFIYNHLALAQMIIWLAEATGVETRLVSKAIGAIVETDSPHTQAAAVRRVLPWEFIARHLRRKADIKVAQAIIEKHALPECRQGFKNAAKVWEAMAQDIADAMQAARGETKP